MSVTVMSMVWRADLSPNHKLVLLAYADHANDAGESVYPGEVRMADKTSYSRASIRRITAELIEAGYLRKVGGGYRGKATEYAINLPLLEGSQIEMQSSERVSDRTERVSDGAGLGITSEHPTIREPSDTNHQVQKRLPALRPNPSEHDQMVYALMAACGYEREDMTEPLWGRTHKAAKLLRQIGATATEVSRRAQLYQVNMPGAALTPTALAANWAALREPRAGPSRKDIDRAVARSRLTEAVDHLDS